MRLRNLALVIASGIAGFLVAGVLVTQLAAPYIEFSLFVGIPVGIVAGIATAALVAVGLGPAAEPGRRRLALSVGTFGIVFLVVLFGVAGGLGMGTVVALVAAVVMGLIAAVATYLRTNSEQSVGGVAGQ